MISLNTELVPIVYHFFAHYRAGVNRELIRSNKYEYLFVGASKDLLRSGIELWNPPENAKFLATKLHYLFGRILFQSHVIRLALRRDIHSIIFLGCAEFASTWFAAALARLTGKKVYFWTHGWTETDKGIKKNIRIIFYRLANDLLLYGHHAKQIGFKLGFSKEHMHVIYNSLDYTSQITAREVVKESDLADVRNTFFGELAALPLLICSGRLIQLRRYDLLLEAMEHLKQEGFSVNLLLIGDGPEMPTIQALAKSKDLSIHCYGACYDELLLARFFMASDLLVMPGRIGLTAMHSLAYGTPVIVHDNPDDQHPEWQAIIPGYNGARFAHNDSFDLARVLRHWLENAPNRQIIRVRCYEVLEKFYNPFTQSELIEQALDGKLADDTAWEDFCRSRSTSVLENQR
jgi:glycosyltransferase involved in cell wall biosynthesis